MRSIAALSIAMACSAVALYGCSEQSATAACHSDVEIGTMPSWATTGFSEGAEVPRAIGHAGRIVAVAFSQPLVATTESEPQNKVLLVAREPVNGPEPVSIEARLAGTDEVVLRERPDGPGPGTLDLPAPGCWELTLHWADQTDVLDLEYVAAASEPAR
ncbi:MAG: hypothetical protein GC156_15745 [Actinomycetales bacterium]|nr:hypothetical protein [Actinomycetales bacterium]